MKIVLDADDTTYFLTAVLRAVREEKVCECEGVSQLVDDWEDEEVNEVREKVEARLTPELNKLMEGLEVGDLHG